MNTKYMNNPEEDNNAVDSNKMQDNHNAAAHCSIFNKDDGNKLKYIFQTKA